MKFYDAAKAVTEIHPAIVVSTLVANKRWFDGLPKDVQVAILDTGAAVDKEAFGFASVIVDRANGGWTANGGQLLRLPPPEQAKMMGELKALGTQILSQNPQVKPEYEELLRVADRVK
jgi:TRAP-type C4-dicarboxylate transport system substrate-binding protein